MYTSIIIVLVLHTISCNGNKKNNETIKDGLKVSLAIWPLRFKPQNMVVSTLPLRLALNKLATLANGEAKTELMTALGVIKDTELTKFYPNLTQKLQCLRESDLIMLNNIFIEFSDSVADSFFANSMKKFGVKTEKLQFDFLGGAVSYINQWVDSATYKRITNILNDDDVDRSTSMLLVNALHMKPTWEYPNAVFDIRLSEMISFTRHNKETVEMRMMTSLYKMFNYCENTVYSFQVLSLPLNCDGCKITYFLPRQVTGLPKLLKAIAEHPDLLKNTVKNLREETMFVHLPVMKIKTYINWGPYLQAIGIRKIFHRKSGLDAISKENHTYFHLSKVIQKVFIEIDEFGIHREAPSMGLNLQAQYDKHLGVTIQEFSATHPFYFKIDISESGVDHELFSGVFYGTD